MITEKSKLMPWTGDEAVAQAVKLVNPDVVAAYPITPQTIIVERFSEFVHNGEVDTEFVPVESEHSAMATCIGASATGARVFTASSSQGIALMYENLFIASGSRLPIVMAVANRALSAPINIHGELTDQMICRDTGWISLFGETAQEAYDETFLAFKIAEHPKVLLPAMFGVEGFIVTHALEGVAPLDKKFIEEFLPEPRYAPFRLHPDSPGAMGLLALPDYYMEIKYQQEIAMKNALNVAKDVFKEFSEMTGRNYEIIEQYMMEDAEHAIVIMGANAGNAKAAVNKLRQEGEKVGVVKIRLYRPFPEEDLRNILKDLKSVSIVDRSATYGCGSTILQEDVSNALYGLKDRPTIHGYIVGLGGRNVIVEDFFKIYEKSKQYNAEGKMKTFEWYNVRK